MSQTNDTLSKHAPAAPPVTRRDFLRTGAACAGGLLGASALGLGASPAGAQQAPRDRRDKRPNFVFILIDDLRDDVFSFAGHPFMKTPHIDRLRREGAHLSNAFVTTALCSPSRASFLTGTYAHTHGVLSNSTQYDPAATPPYPLLLQRSGYASAHIGKWHMGHDDPHPRPGFDRWISFPGQGQYFDQTLTDENNRQIPTQGYITDILTDYAEEFIARQSADPDKPFSLILSHKAVHAPFQPAPRHQDIYAESALVEPPSYRHDMADKPPWMREENPLQESPLLRRDRLSASEAAAYRVPAQIEQKPWEPRHAARLNYFKALQAVDDSVGRVLAALEKSGVLDDTVIVFAGDNGYFLGEFGRNDKRLMFEPSIRVAMLVRYPPLAAPGSTVEHMTLNIDMAPTFLELAGVPAPAVTQGRSWTPLLRGEQTRWRTSFLYEYFMDLSPGIPNLVGVRTQNAKLVTYPDVGKTTHTFLPPMDELYDLRRDPHEMTNLIASPQSAALKRELETELARLKRETGYRDDLPWRLRHDGELLLLHLSPSLVRDGKILNGAAKSALGPNGNVSLGSAAVVQDGKRQALRFGGAQRLEVPSHAALQPVRRDWTIEAWVKPQADGVILAHGGERSGYVLFVDGGKPQLSVRTFRWKRVADAPRSILGERTHLVGVLDNHVIRLFVNGQQVAAIDQAFVIDAPLSAPLVIGGESGSRVDDKAPTGGFEGLLYDLKIHSRALSAQEISASYRAGGQ